MIYQCIPAMKIPVPFPFLSTYNKFLSASPYVRDVFREGNKGAYVNTEYSLFVHLAVQASKANFKKKLSLSELVDDMDRHKDYEEIIGFSKLKAFYTMLARVPWSRETKTGALPIWVNGFEIPLKIGRYEAKGNYPDGILVSCFKKNFCPEAEYKKIHEEYKALIDRNRQDTRTN